MPCERNASTDAKPEQARRAGTHDGQNRDHGRCDERGADAGDQWRTHAVNGVDVLQAMLHIGASLVVPDEGQRGRGRKSD